MEWIGETGQWRGYETTLIAARNGAEVVSISDRKQGRA